MLRSTVRSGLQIVSSSAASSPIEAITATFIIITLIYFQLLHAIKGSEFFAPPPDTSPPPRPIHLARLSNPDRIRIEEGHSLFHPSASIPAQAHQPYFGTGSAVGLGQDAWIPLPAADFRRILEADALEGGYVFPPELGGNTAGDKAEVVLVKQFIIVREEGDAADERAWAQWLLHDFGVEVQGRKITYQDLCFECNVHLEPHPIYESQSTVTLFLRPPSPETPTLAYLSQLARLPPFTQSAGSNATVRIMPPSTGSWGFLPSFDGAGLFSGVGDGSGYNSEKEEEELLSGLRNVRWFAYAVRAFVMRFVALAKNADSADIFVVLLGYILMHVTFVHLFMRMRNLGSSFWLPFATLVSSIFGFLTALLAAHLLNVPIDPVSMSEALPFLVITVGFDKPFLLARAVFQNPDIAPVAASTAASPTEEFSAPDGGTLGLDLGALHKELAPLERLQRLAEGKGVRWAAPVAAKTLVTDAVSKSGVSIVRDYAIEVAVLSVGAASGIGGLREFCYLAALIMVADCVFLFSFYVAILAVMVEVHRIKLIRGKGRAKHIRRNSSHGSLLSSTSDSPTAGTWFRSNLKSNKAVLAASKKDRKLKEKDEKVIDGQPENPVVRLKLFLIISFLSLHILNLCTTLTEQTALKRHTTHPALPKFSPRIEPRTANLTPILDALYSAHGAETDMAVQIVPPTNIVVTSDAYVQPSRMASIDHFMSEWTQLVGDPVLSKWIVVSLGISVLLNGYLLKGIASNSIGGRGPVAFAAQALAGVFEPGSFADSKKRRWSGGQELSQYRAERVREARGSIHHAQGALSLTPKGRSKVGLPPHIPHPAPNGHLPGDQTPKGSTSTSPALTTSTSVNGHVEIPHTPSVPIISEPVRRSSYSSMQGSGNGESFGRRSLEECVEIFAGGVGANNLSDEEVIFLVEKGKVAPYNLEKSLKNLERAVRVRRAVISRGSITQTLEASALPMVDYDYKQIIGACCENVIGYMPIPVGIAGPLSIDGQMLHIPMATTEGTLVASTSRGCKALNAGGGVTTVLTHDAMTRGPAIDFPNIRQAADARLFIDSPQGHQYLKEAFESTSKFAKLRTLECALAGRTLYVRFATSTGDAMGMNMISKGTEKALEALRERFPDMQVLALSGNYCTDKKPAAINWIEGRGKSVVAEAVIPRSTVEKVLKTSVEALCNLNIKKNLIGSAMAGSIGGFNAHAANILTAVYIATGQDPAQNVESSNCMTLMEPTPEGDLLMTVSMPSVEVGTVGGGTILSPQRAMLEFLGIAGAHPTSPGANAQRLARIIAAAVMAGELSLMSALAAGHLIQAHMKHNRSVPVTPGVATPGGPTAVWGGMTPLRQGQSGLPTPGLSPKIGLSGIGSASIGAGGNTGVPNGVPGGNGSGQPKNTETGLGIQNGAAIHGVTGGAGVGAVIAPNGRLEVPSMNGHASGLSKKGSSGPNGHHAVQ